MCSIDLRSRSAISSDPQSAIRNPQSRFLALSLFVLLCAAHVQGADCNQNGVPDERERVPVTFGLADGLLPVPPDPQVIKTGDFNGDELADIVVLSRSDDDSFLPVFLSDSSRTYSAGIESPVVGRAHAFALADFDGDGNLDVATANHEFLLVFSGDGDGTFAEPVRYDEHLGARFVTVGDVNGDGSPDLIHGRSRQTSVGLRLNRGDGTFGARLLVPVGSNVLPIASDD